MEHDPGLPGPGPGYVRVEGGQPAGSVILWCCGTWLKVYAQRCWLNSYQFTVVSALC